MTKLEKKIAELEERIKKLEARPGGETHHHYHYETPNYRNPALPGPEYPNPWWTQPITWCGAVGVNDLVDRTGVTFKTSAITYGPEN